MKKMWLQQIVLLMVGAVIFSLGTACSIFSADRTAETNLAASTSTLTDHTPAVSQVTPASTDGWFALHQRMPYPYTTPLPSPTTTAVDGTYTKFEPKEGTPVPCKRCPDYAPEGGIWKLSLAKGVFRIFHPATGWRSIGSFTTSDHRLAIFNDPNCLDVTGLYTWKLEAQQLTLQVLEDKCAIGLRAKNLTGLPWASCQPPNQEAAITDHWSKPSGC